MPERGPRVMWLLNHTTARDFEVDMLKRCGFGEIFLPKSFPQELQFRSASVEHAEDAQLTIPADDLALLNAADWYGSPGRDAWAIASRHFDLIFSLPASASIFEQLAKHFQGAAILRTYGGDRTFSHRIQAAAPDLKRMGRRFWLGSAYPNLATAEPAWLRQRELLFPAGLLDCQVRSDWNGSKPAVFVVCPDVAGNSYYAELYAELKRQLGALPFAVGGAQSVEANDPRVLGFLSLEQHHRNLREFRAMYYNSCESGHVHYHPIEAVRAGMPLVFLAGGLLDRLGGANLPGRCSSPREAHRKLRRILDGDRALIESIRSSQIRLLDPFRPDALEPVWRRGLTQVMSELNSARARVRPSRKRPRIAVVLPVAYRGGTLRSAKLLARAIWSGSRESHEDVDVVFAHAEDPFAGDEMFADLPPCVGRRQIQWTQLDAATARRAMRFAGHSEWNPAEQKYMLPDDGAQQLCDCDLWLVVSDRLTWPVLPIRPYALMVFDYQQRYNPRFQALTDAGFLAAARSAQRVLVTTRFTATDALVYAGVAHEKLARVPMLATAIAAGDVPPVEFDARTRAQYFLWTTNRAPHKNHTHAMRALRDYYELLHGKLECRVSGVETDQLLAGGLPHLEPARAAVASSEPLARNLKLLGELPDRLYAQQLAGANFLWHPARIDNGSLCVVEAAFLGVPSLSSRYPAMEEMDQDFRLNLTWSDPGQPSQTALHLKWMEENAGELRSGLPHPNDLMAHSPEFLGRDYWKVLRECL